MALTPSNMLPLGSPAPDFSLRDAVKDRTVSLKDFTGSRAFLVMFICNHCPYVNHVMDQLGPLTSTYMSKGVGIVGINSNSIVTHPADGPENMRALAIERDWKFPFLFDETQSVAKEYHAACTPDFFLFDGDLKLVYRGQLDDSRPGGSAPVTGRDLTAAVDAALAGEPVLADQKPSIGCNIKWARGNEPSYSA